MLDLLHNILPSTQQYRPLLCGDPVLRDHERRQRRRKIRTEFGRSRRSEVQWGPTHSFDSDDDDDDDNDNAVKAIVSGSNFSMTCGGTDAATAKGGRKTMGNDTGTTCTTQCSSSKEMSSKQQQPTPPTTSATTIASGTATATSNFIITPTKNNNNNNSQNVTQTTTPIEQNKQQQQRREIHNNNEIDNNNEDLSMNAMPAASCSGTLDQIWNRATEFAREYITSPEGYCQPCGGNLRDDYVTVHTVSTTHRHEKGGGGNTKRSNKKKNNQGSTKHERHPLEALGPIDINIDNVSMDDSSLTSHWHVNEFTKTEQEEQHQQQRSVRTKASMASSTKRSINTEMNKENQDHRILNQVTTPTTMGSTVHQSPPPPPDMEEPNKGKKYLKSPLRTKTKLAHRRSKSTKSLSSQKKQQLQQGQQEQEQQQHHHHHQQQDYLQHPTTPKTTDAHKQPSQQQQEASNTGLHVYPQKSQRTLSTGGVAKLSFDSITFSLSQVAALERSISELTMRSCYADELAKYQQQYQYESSDNRRMAYYAVGRKGGSGEPSSNRRCYFSGRLIRGSRPFYAGSVQQGLRTLVVFCLPRTLGLPHRSQLNALLSTVPKKNRVMCNNNNDDNDEDADDSHMAKEIDHLLDEGVLRPEQVLDILPHPGVGSGMDLLTQMETEFPDQYATLPQQVRVAKCWRLYFKFCFFSGLPIADGEMYYKVTDKTMDRLRSRSRSKSRSKMLNSSGHDDAMAASKKSKQSGGVNVGDELAGVEEIILSHEIMEAVNGEQSAQILRLPNKKTFRYLQKQYRQQCAKLGGKVFDRTSWEMVMPEV